MPPEKIEIKLAFTSGLKEVVANELKPHKELHVVRQEDDAIHLDFTEDFSAIKKLRSVARAYVIIQGPKYHPRHISNHKSIIGDLIQVVLNGAGPGEFKTFKITCAGSESKEVRTIIGYVKLTFGLVEKDEADLKIHIIRSGDVWEIGIQITPRPLSLRDYKIENMKGAMDPTIAYAMNSLCGLGKATSYLNVFSGSATLLIEAAQSFPNLKQLIGFDNNKKNISLAIQNIKEAGLIKSIQLKEKDIFDMPDLGKFDVITADLPFGMYISKDEDLEDLYRNFVEYCQDYIKPDGTLAVYTSEYEILEKIFPDSKFDVTKTLELKFMTNAKAYLYPKIFVCKFK